MSKLEAHFQATDFAAPRVVTVLSSIEEFQALAMRLAAKVLLPGIGWIALKQLADLVVLKMDLLGKRFLPRGYSALFDFHTIKAVCDATISSVL